jgi:hypothetical protein
MAEQHSDQTREQAGSGLKRRGLLAAAWAAVAALVARHTAEPVSATTTDTNFVATGTGTGFSTMGDLFSVGASVRGTGYGVIAEGNSTGLYAVGANYGVYADGPQFVGVYGAGPSVGVRGSADSSTTGSGLYGTGATGVYGSGAKYGVWAAGVLNGVYGQISTNIASAAAVFGHNLSPGFSSMGVRGTVAGSVTGAATIGVRGENFSSNTGGAPGAGGVGVSGYSQLGHGVVGATSSPGAAGVVGSSQGAAGVWAGVFFGPFAVVGGAKSAAIANDDGTYRLLYCMESPESWFEDFGEATLECGRADVAIDPAFGAIADLTDYHVFLTAHDRDHYLAVTARTPSRFRVEADVDLAHLKGRKDTDLSGTFSWRLVAKRKDITAPRFAKVQLAPAPTQPDPPATPEWPALPRRPAMEHNVPRTF